MGRQMGIFSHTLRAVVTACGLAGFGATAALAAARPEPAMPFDSVAAEPFGLSTVAVPGGALNEKWQKLKRALDDERVQLALCDGDRDNCTSDAALQLLAIVDDARRRDGRARLGEINRAINLALRPMSDFAQYGEVDVWTSPLVTFAHGAGDCEDYAIAKVMALWLAGIAADDLRIIIMRDTFHGGDHAVAAVRLDGHWLMLDNMRMAMVEDIHVRNYRPLFAIDQSSIMRFSDLPLLASTSGAAHDATAATAPNDPPAEPGLVAVSQ
jgi:predicted transglutaminase-like cysteine proteinase